MGIARVQLNHAEAAGFGTTIGATLNGVAAASLILGRTTNDSSGSVTVSGMADDLAVNAVRSGAAANNGTLFQRVDHWYFENYGGGNRTFTATYSGSVQFRGIDVVELSGALLAGSAGPTSSATGTSAAPSSGATGVPASDGTYFFGTCAGPSQPAAAAPFGTVLQDTNDLVTEEEYVQPSAAALAATWTMTSGAWAAIVSTYYPAVSAIPSGRRLIRESFGSILTEDNKMLLTQ
jgi:hypothetical protein